MTNYLIFHHIGIACRDIRETKPFYESIGYVAGDIIEDPIQDVFICFLDKPGMPRVELLAPVDGKSPVNRILATVGVSPYHICYEVADIYSAIKELKTQHFVIVSKPVSACAINGKRVCFLYNKDVGLLELVENEILRF